MKTIKYTIILLIGLCFGAVGARMYYGHLMVEKLSQLILASSKGQVVEAANSLTLLHEQKYDSLIKDKEELLSSQVYALSFMPLPTDKNDVQAYKMAARYYQKYPLQTGDTNTDIQIKNFLDKINELPSQPKQVKQ